ncbi:MAG TPA: DUF427 domain-containing protein [Candidatus Limnocylindrales bacterium]|nr:DUF427 domain-containing protein [Candidatus Limnocylindrales bacterium]
MSIARVRPGPGQESVWDYPRPPRVAPDDRNVRVVFNGVTVAESSRAIRVLETAGAPVWYVPPDDVRTDLLEPIDSRTVCEWKGDASYFDLRVGDRVARSAAWTYPRPRPGYESIAGYVAFYAGRVDAAFVGDERATPQPGDFYGGWITSDVVGPFKGEPGTGGW